MIVYHCLKEIELGTAIHRVLPSTEEAEGYYALENPGQRTID
jgi:hypothetical protein